jgi:hypothetical protein
MRLTVLAVTPAPDVVQVLLRERCSDAASPGFPKQNQPTFAAYASITRAE